MKRPVLGICGKCSLGDDAIGEAFFRAVKKERKKRGLKPVLKVKEVGCLDGCDTPCNAELRGKRRPTLRITRLDPAHDVATLLEAAVRYAQGDGEPTLETLKLPGRPA